MLSNDKLLGKLYVTALYHMASNVNNKHIYVNELNREIIHC